MTDIDDLEANLETRLRDGDYSEDDLAELAEEGNATAAEALRELDGCRQAQAIQDDRLEVEV